jgi:hypothetical protein
MGRGSGDIDLPDHSRVETCERGELGTSEDTGAAGIRHRGERRDRRGGAATKLLRTAAGDVRKTNADDVHVGACIHPGDN